MWFCFSERHAKVQTRTLTPTQNHLWAMASHSATPRAIKGQNFFLHKISAKDYLPVPDFALATVMFNIPQLRMVKLLTRSKATPYRNQSNWRAGEGRRPTQVSMLYSRSPHYRVRPVTFVRKLILWGPQCKNTWERDHNKLWWSHNVRERDHKVVAMT